jgi:hypothetical protein
MNYAATELLASKLCRLGRAETQASVVEMFVLAAQIASPVDAAIIARAIDYMLGSSRAVVVSGRRQRASLPRCQHCGPRTFITQAAREIIRCGGSFRDVQGSPATPASPPRSATFPEMARRSGGEAKGGGAALSG